MRHLELEHEQGDGDGEDRVGEEAQPLQRMVGPAAPSSHARAHRRPPDRRDEPIQPVGRLASALQRSGLATGLTPPGGRLVPVPPWTRAPPMPPGEPESGPPRPLSPPPSLRPGRASPLPVAGEAAAPPPSRPPNRSA